MMGNKEGSVHLFGFLLSLIFALIMPYNFVIFSVIKTMYFTLKIYVIWVLFFHQEGWLLSPRRENLNLKSYRTH